LSISSDPTVRAATILRTSRRLFEENGPWGLRISAIAKDVGISVGTFYSHFSSKEDLVLALARDTISARLSVFEASFSLPDLNAAEQVIVSVLRNFLFSFDNPSLFAMERFAMSPAIWEGASDQARTAIGNEHRLVTGRARVQVKRAIEDGSLKAPGDLNEQSALVLVGIWTIANGSNQVELLRLILEDEAHPTRRLPRGFTATIRAFMVGSGWATEDPDADMKRLSELALGMEFGEE